jgi:hypothetical protein
LLTRCPEHAFYKQTATASHERQHRTLTIAGISIRQDAQGRFCLNDLHKAAGNLPKDQPAKYFAIQQAKDLISEIGEHSVHTVRGYGKDQGTYVCKELVYAYAMWISPKFHLQVIRAYDELVTKKQGKASRRQMFENRLFFKHLPSALI